MASEELRIQRNIILAVKACGGWGIKLSNQFSAGIPDLSLQEPGYPGIMAEVKMISLPRRDDDQIKTTLTPLQRQTILDNQKAGGCSGLLLCYKRERLESFMCTRRVKLDEMPTKKEFIEQCLIRPFGLPLEQLIKAGLLRPLLSPMLRDFSMK